MVKIRSMSMLLGLLILGLLLPPTVPVVQGGPSPSRIIDLFAEGPQPRRLTIAVGTVVVWNSHLAPTKLFVTTVTFQAGRQVAQATMPVAGYNGFILEGEHYVGRMEGNGGQVALRFATPGEYTYTVDHQKHLGGVIVVKE